MTIERLTPDHSLWTDFCAHLHRHAMYKRIIANDSMLQPAVYALCAVVDDRIIGHLALKMQQIAFLRSTEDDNPIHILDMPQVPPLRELFAQTFAVDMRYRRQGHGRALQTAALELGQRLGCFQMRAWSPLEASANCALMFTMGFAAHPVIQITPTGEHVAGIYFIMALDTHTTE